MQLKKVTIQLIKLTTIVVLGISCKSKPPVDLAKLALTEKIENVINFSDTNYIGIETMELPVAMMLETEGSNSFTFNGIALENARIMFQVKSDKIRKDSTIHSGGAYFSSVRLKNQDSLKKYLKEYEADSTVYGFRLRLTTDELKTKIKNELIKLYGAGTKNPNTDNGLYWHLKKENKFVLFAPDYDRLIIINNTNISKACYWDNMNGLIDFGGCDKDLYDRTLLR
jgi:hypothetical protein